MAIWADAAEAAIWDGKGWRLVGMYKYLGEYRAWWGYYVG